MSVRVAGHFGEWLQGRLGPAGPLALVTLACPALAVRATWSERAGPFAIDQDPCVIDAGRARAFLAALGLPAAGRVTLRAAMPPGGGAGASTATLVALARAAGFDGPTAALAAACLAAEGATDPLMQPRPDAHLWAPRAARCLGALPPPPAADIVGGFLGAPERTRPEDLDFPDIADLVARWRDAGADLAERGAIATESLRRTTRLRGPADDPTEALGIALGALGVARAHTGSARALVFAPGTAPARAAAALGAAGFSCVVTFRTGGGT